MAIFLAKLAYLPTGFAIRRFNIHRRTSNNELTGSTIKDLVDNMSFSQLFLLESLGNKMDDAAYGELLKHVHREHFQIPNLEKI